MSPQLRLKSDANLLREPTRGSLNLKTQYHVQIPLAISGEHELAGDILVGAVLCDLFREYSLDNDPEEGLHRQDVKPSAGR